MEFYTYAYLRNDGTPYYIGKGKGKRAFVNHKHVPVPQNRDKIKFLKQNLSESEAFRHEEYMISVFGRKLDGGILINLSTGGGGSSGFKMTDAQKQSISDALKGNQYSKSRKTITRDVECRRKISEANMGNSNALGCKHPPRSLEHSKKQSIANGKLTVDQVKEIRELSKNMNGNKISKIYGLARSSVYDIIKRKSYKHIK